MRVLPGEGLVYASSAPIRTSARDLVAASSAGQAVAGTAVAAPLVPANGSAAAQGAIGGAWSTSPLPGWARVTSMSPGLPLTAVGQLQGIYENGFMGMCTGTLFARHAFVTAAVSDGCAHVHINSDAHACLLGKLMRKGGR